MKPAFWHSAIILILVSLIAMAVGLVYSQSSADLRSQDFQPIAFSHELHAGKLAVDCRSSHRAAHQSPRAGLPTVSLCVGCHQNVDAKQNGIEALLDHWKRQQPVAWVYFTHERHLARDVQCVDCHGHVESAPHTPRAATYEMGLVLGLPRGA
jgi:hypothetical protein